MPNRHGGNLQSATGRRGLEQRREPYWVRIVPGCSLGYRKGSTGGSWIARKRGSDGKQIYLAIGPADDGKDSPGMPYAEALEHARAFFGVAAQGSARRTVSDALDAYLRAVNAKNPASTRHDARLRVDAIIRPALGNLTLGKLTHEHVENFRRGLMEGRRPETVNRIVAILRAALNLAYKKQWIGTDRAWRHVGRIQGSNPRKVFLSLGQCRDLLAACTSPALRNLVRAALLTGARLGELADLRVHDFDASTGTLEVRDGKTGQRTVYLSGESVQFFETIARGKRGAELLLPRDDDAVWGKNHHQKPFLAAVKAARLPADTVFYSLRHSHISQALLAAVNIQVLAENTGTSVRMIEQHYGKFLGADRRRMFDRLPVLS